MATITIRSGFHPNMSVTVRVGKSGLLNARQMAKIRRGLCSGGDCQCGGLARSTIDEGGYIYPAAKGCSSSYERPER